MRRLLPALLAALVTTAGATAAQAGEARRSSFGRLPDGREVAAVTLANGNGIEATVIAWGASLQALRMPGRDGTVADVIVGHPTLEGHLRQPEYFGATVGRVANRIAGGRFTLDRRTYRTPVNDGPNTLHGGTEGFDKKLWEVVSVESGPTASVTLRLVSPHGDQGFPGRLTVDAVYSLDEANVLTIEYRATTDRPTVVNLSNHAYWNLSGAGSNDGAMGHILQIAADRYTPVDETLIPTGERRSVDGTVFDFRRPQMIGERVRDGRDPQIAHGRGYDHNWVVGDRPTADQQLMARLHDPRSGRGFELWSNQPGLQFYSGNFLIGTIRGKDDRIYRGGDAIALEPQSFPDTVNQPDFGSARLDPGQTYRTIMSYRLSTGQPTATPAR